MESDAERTMCNLVLLSSVTQNDKLYTSENMFTISPPTTLRSLWRAWYGERRANNVQHVRQTVRAGIAFAHRTLEEALAPNEMAPRASLRHATLVLQHERMLEALRNARTGIENLDQTYFDDPALLTQLQLVRAEIDDFLAVIAPHTCNIERPSPPHGALPRIGHVT